tara:strand:+ start:216 stop:539 length:324 start_codon:yes stop_codon:yes gene_type:complete
MKLKNFLFFLVVSIFVSLIGNLFTNIKINEISKNLSTVNNEIVKLQIIKDQTFNLYQEHFSIQNIEKLSASLNYEKLDVYIINKNLSSPYKLDSELVQIDILGSLGR